MVAGPRAGKGKEGVNIEHKQLSKPDAAAPAAQPNGVAQADVASLEFPAPLAAAGADVADAPSTSPVRTSGLHTTPLGTGVQNATQRCVLPSPAIAVRNLVEQAQFAHLCTIMSGMHHRRAGYPFGTLVDFASDGAGYPIFCLSPLAIQTRNIQEDPRCSLVVQLPGYAGLANARVTIFGDVYQLPKDLQQQAREIFHAKHAGNSNSRDGWVGGNAIYFRMNSILDIYFVGGFGTVQWVNSTEYTSVEPDLIVLNNPTQTLRALNKAFAASLRDLLSRPGQLAADDVAFISIDRLGTDVRVRRGEEYSVVRIGFESSVDSLEEVMAVMPRLLRDPVALKLEA